MSEFRSAYEEAEARAIELAKAAVKAARREMEEYDNLLTAARAVVDWAESHSRVKTQFVSDEWVKEIPLNLIDALIAAVEAADQQ